MSRCSFKIRAVLAAAFLAALFLFPMRVSAQSPDYTIQSYAVQMAVSRQNIFDVTETIGADFSAPKHGIIRTIPVWGTAVAQVNGRTVRTSYHNGVNGVSVSDGATGRPIPFSRSWENGNVVLKIGSSDQTITGRKTYVIRYRYLVGQSAAHSGYDEVYYNLIGTGWDTQISQTTFRVVMPGAFDPAQLSFTAGAQGTSDESAVSYQVSGNTVTGRVTRSLAAGEGLTMRLQLPEGYFRSADATGGWVLVVIFLLMAGGSVCLFLRFGRDRRLYVPVEVSPPEDLNSAEAGYIIDGHADTRDVVSLIIYWADKGYLSISNDRHKNFTLHRLREPDAGMKPYEAKMFARLFRDGDSVRASQLQNSFYTTVRMVKNELAGSFLRADRRLFTPSGNTARAFCYTLAGLSVGIMSGRAVGQYFFSAAAGWVAGGICGALAVLLAVLVGYMADKDRAGSKAGVAGAMILDAVFLFAAALASGLLAQPAIVGISGALCAAVSGVSGAYAKKRTPQGAKWLGSMMGLRRFIRLAEKPRIEKMVEEDPTVFYHILPYAFVLGVTDKWAGQFERIAVPPPGWFDDESGSLFSTVYFCMLLNRNMTVYQTQMVSVPQNTSGSSGGSFSGGGGFTGGGMGGGGGSSW